MTLWAEAPRDGASVLRRGWTTGTCATAASRAAFEALLARKGADLVIHGHNHRFSLAWRAGVGHDVPIVGVPSASIGPLGHGELATWHLFRIEGDAKEPQITLEQRGFEADGSVVRRQEIGLRMKPV